MNVADMMLSRGEDSAPAVLHKGTVVTYARLRQETERARLRLQATAGREDDRVGILSENSPFFIAAYLGIMRSNMVAVPLPTDITQETFEKIIGDAGIRQIFVSRASAVRIRPWVDRTAVRCIDEEEAVRDGIPATSGISSAVNSRSWALAALYFTSGSTGTPKGVMITHRNIECNTRDIISYMGLTSADRVMVVLPFHYCFGLSLLHSHLMVGGSMVLNNDFRLFPETVLKDMQEKECTGLAGVPSTYQILLRTSRFRRMSFPKLRWFQQAGGKLPNPCIEEIVSSFPHIKYYLMYGQTEATARLSYLPPDRLADKLGSIGKGLESTKLEVTKTDGTPVAPGSGEVGEIVASGDNIALGYWNDPIETGKFFRNRKLHTGDLAIVDGDGFVFVVERERDMIKSGGNRVSAKEVEDVIAEVPEVVEVAVVGVPHDLLGESIRAFVVLHPKAILSETELLAHCRKRLPLFKTPEEVILLKTMPHNGAGKVMKQELKLNPFRYALHEKLLNQPTEA